MSDDKNIEDQLLEDKIMEDLILWEYSHDDAYRKDEKKHFFSFRHRKRHRDYMRSLYRKSREDQQSTASGKTVRFHRTQKKVAKVAAAACIAVVALTAVHVTATNVQHGKLGNSLLQGFDDHVQFSDKAARPKILKWLDEQSSSGDAIAGKEDSKKGTVPSTESSFEKKTPQYLPEGYVLVNEEDYKFMEYFTQEYTDSHEHYLYYSQYADMHNTGLSSETETPQHMQINGMDGILTSDAVTHTLIWTDGAYYYCLNGTVDEDTLLEIAVNVN